jgi:hypothetical protein
MCQPDVFGGWDARLTLDIIDFVAVLPPPAPSRPDFPECARHEVARVLRECRRRAGAAISKGGPAHHAIKRLAGGPARALGSHQRWERG